MGYQKILVTLDGSSFSERALKEVVRVAEPNAYIHLLSVKADTTVNEANAMAKAAQANGPVESWPPIHPVPDPLQPEARDRYLAEVEDWLAQAEYHVSTESHVGDVIETILKVARDGYDVLIMVTHGRTGIAKTVLGSVTEAVLHHSPCPVLVIPASVA